MRIPYIPTRAVFAGIFLVIVGLVADAVFYLQGELALEPCPMCILSRYTFVAIAVVALVAAIHGPRNVALKVYGGLIVLLGLTGIGISVRHSYLQHFPPPDVACGADLDFIVNTFPLSQALPKIFSGSGSCSKIDWVFLGLTIPEWALVWFAIFTATATWVAFVRRPPQ